MSRRPAIVRCRSRPQRTELKPNTNAKPAGNDVEAEAALMEAIGVKSTRPGVAPSAQANSTQETLVASTTGEAPKATDDEASARESGTAATLGINSIPASHVTLDGNALGHTPRLGVSVKPGQHTVVFEHPEHGKRSVSVEPGDKRVVSVRFKR
jgi:serine/threonine-protein kinase